MDATAPGPSNRIYKYRFEPTDMPRVGSAVGLLTRTVVNQPESEVRVSALLLLGPGAAGCASVRGLRRSGSKHAAARQAQRFIRRSWHNVCVTHCSGSSQRRDKIEELGPLRGKGRGGACTDSTCVQRSPVPAGIYMCIDMYVGVCVRVCVCVCVRVCVCILMMLR